MNVLHINNADLNLLKVAAALYRHRNVSKASAELGLSQSAVSHALARLRDQLGDEFFVRTSRGVAPTEYARRVQTEIVDLVARAEALIARRERFDPATSQARITIATTDYFETVALARLQATLAELAPSIQISIRPTLGDLPRRELEDGQIDLAIAGFYRDLPEGFYQTKLFTDDFVCAVGANHKLFKTVRLSEDAYSKARHAQIALKGDLRESEKKRTLERKLVYATYSFTSLAWTLQDSDLLLTAPRLLIEQYEKFFPIRQWPCPVERERIDIRMIWHSQTHSDPLQKWFREQLKSVCEKLR